MKKILLGVSLLCVLSMASAAQTYYQLQPHTCLLANYNCNGLPLNVPGDLTAAYSFGGSSTGTPPELVIGGYFSILVKNGVTDSGRITHIFQQIPPLKKGNHGPFSFGVTLKSGHLGVVSGQVKVLQACHRYCWPYAIVESSTVVIK